MKHVDHNLIVVDGGVCTGKTTLASFIAKDLNQNGIKAIAFSTGKVYRIIAHLTDDIQHPVQIQTIRHYANDDSIGIEYVKDQIHYHRIYTQSDIKALDDEDIAKKASAISSQRNVRENANRAIKELVNSLKTEYAMVVLDGRDLQTVLFPTATVKIYLELQNKQEAAVRAISRAKGIDKSLVSQAEIDEEVRKITSRDKADSTRAIAPLKASDAKDVIKIDTSALTIAQTLTKVKEMPVYQNAINYLLNKKDEIVL